MSLREWNKGREKWMQEEKRNKLAHHTNGKRDKGRVERQWDLLTGKEKEEKEEKGEKGKGKNESRAYT